MLVGELTHRLRAPGKRGGEEEPAPTEEPQDDFEEAVPLLARSGGGDTPEPPPEIGTSSRLPGQVGLFDVFQCGCRRGAGRCTNIDAGLPPAGWQFRGARALCPACFLGGRYDCTCERCATMNVDDTPTPPADGQPLHKATASAQEDLWST